METNEQKAKAYDEVLERVKEMYAHTANGYAKQIMEQIFPELKESKSERIRREMIEFLKKKRQETYVPISWIEWLKEQKEFVSADFDEVWDALGTDWTTPINGISIDVLRAVCQKWFSKGAEIERKKRFEKQDEQKADWSEEDEKMLNNLHSWMKEFSGAEEYTEKVYQWIKGLLEKQDESIPVWSEEDETYRIGILVKLEPHIADDDFTGVQNWFKSVKNRLNKTN